MNENKITPKEAIIKIHKFISESNDKEINEAWMFVLDSLNTLAIEILKSK